MRNYLLKRPPTWEPPRRAFGPDGPACWTARADLQIPTTNRTTSKEGGAASPAATNPIPLPRASLSFSVKQPGGSGTRLQTALQAPRDMHMDMHRERPAACREIACEIGFLRFSSISIKSSESSVAALLRELRSLLALLLLKVCNHIWCCLSSQPVELARVAARSTRPMRTGEGSALSSS